MKLRRIRVLIRREVAPRKRQGTFVVEASIERSEELRVDRLGPGVDDIDTSLPDGEERPRKTLSLS